MITLSQYATTMASVDAGNPLPEVIAALKLDLAGWQTANEHWREHLQAQVERGERAAIDSYLVAYNRQYAISQRERPQAENVTANAVSRSVFTSEDETTPKTVEPSRTEPPPSAGCTEPLSAEALAAVQTATNQEHTGLPFKPDEWTLDRYATLEKQIDHHPGAIAAVLAHFDIDFAQYVTLRGRFADALRERRRAARSGGNPDAHHRTAKASGQACKS